MNPLVLFIGSSAMFITGFIFNSKPDMAVGLGLMWIGFAVLKDRNGWKK